VSEAGASCVTLHSHDRAPAPAALLVISSYGLTVQHNEVMYVAVDERCIGPACRYTISQYSNNCTGGIQKYTDSYQTYIMRDKALKYIE
jgi:hypothetical protein